MQAIAAVSTFLSLIPALLLLVGSSWLIISFVEDITNDLDVLNSIGRMSQRCHRMKKQYFCNIINLHTELKGLSRIKKKVVEEENDTKYIFHLFVSDLLMILMEYLNS